MARHAPFGTAGNGNGRIASRGPQSRSAPRRTGNCRAAPSFRRVLGLVVEHVIGPRLIADHVVGVIGRLVSRRAAGADAGRYGGYRPVDLGVAEKRQRVALPAGAIDRGVARKRSLVQRSNNCPPLTINASGTVGTSIQSPVRVWNARPGTSLGASRVKKLVSVCGAMPNSSSGAFVWEG